MKNLVLYLILIVSICCTEMINAQHRAIPQPTTEYQAASAPNPNIAGGFATVGNSNGQIQFYQHDLTILGPILAPAGVTYFHQDQSFMDVIDIVYTKATCGFPEGYFITGNARIPGVAGKNIFVARLTLAGAPLWYKEFPVQNSGGVKAIAIGQVPDATPNQPETNRVFFIGSASNGTAVAASLDHCGTPAWGPFTYNTPNIPTFPEDLAYLECQNQVVFTGSSANSAAGFLNTWIAGIDASSGAPNWCNNYPVNNGSGDNGTAIAVNGQEICVTGRATLSNGPNLYTLKVGCGGNPIWQNVYLPMTGTASDGQWGEDVIASNANPSVFGGFTVIGRDGATGNTFIHELDPGGVPIGGTEFIYPLTVPNNLRDQITLNPVDPTDPTNPLGSYYISTNMADNAGDYLGIWTPTPLQPLPCGPLDFPFDFMPQQSLIISDCGVDYLAPWVDKEFDSQDIDLNQVDPCQDVPPPCEIFTDFCFNVDLGTVTFNNLSTGTGTLSYQWDFGDSNTSTAMNPTHVYAGPGTYTVCLTIINTMPDGTVCCYTCCKEITIFPPCYDNINGPTFNYLYKNDGSIKFNNPAGSGGAFTKEWTIDGSYHSNLNQPPSITLTPGFHLVCLTVTKNSNPNCSETFCRNIWVDDPCTVPNTAKIVYENCLNSTAVDFTAVGIVTDPSTIYDWDFGDGNMGSGMNVSHTYGTYGTYMVCVKIQNTPNCIKTMCAMITVSAPVCSNPCKVGVVSQDSQDVPFDKLNDGTELQIMPNPISNTGTAVFSEIQSEKATVIISDMSGKTISQNSIQKGTRNYEFDMSNLPSGMYIITLQHSDGTMTASKIIKE